MKRLALVLVVVMAFVVSSCSKKQSEVPSSPVNKDIAQHLLDISSSYLDKADRNIQPIYGDKTRIPIERIIGDAFSDFSEIPEVEKQKDLFQSNYNILVAEEVTGAEIVVIGEYQKSPKIKFYIVPADSMEEIAKYEKPYQTVMIRNIMFSSIWLKALLGHEMEHARNGDYATEMTEELTEAEVHCHGLTGRILDYGTGGQYFQRLQKVVSQKQKTSSITDFYLSVNSEDIFFLDSLFPHPNIIEAQARVTQYLIDLGNVWADRNFEGEKREEMKKAVYLFIRFGRQP